MFATTARGRTFGASAATSSHAAAEPSRDCRPQSVLLTACGSSGSGHACTSPHRPDRLEAGERSTTSASEVCLPYYKVHNGLALQVSYSSTLRPELILSCGGWRGALAPSR